MSNTKSNDNGGKPTRKKRKLNNSKSQASPQLPKGLVNGSSSSNTTTTTIRKSKTAIKDPTGIFMTQPKRMSGGHMKFVSNEKSNRDHYDKVESTSVIPAKSYQNQRLLRLHPDKWKVSCNAVFPMEALGRRGFWDVKSVQGVLECISKEIRDDAQSIIDMKRKMENMKITSTEEATATTNSNKKGKRGKRNNSNDVIIMKEEKNDPPASSLSTAKITLPFGDIITRYGFSIKTSKTLIDGTMIEFSKDREQKYLKFFQDDEIEDVVFHKPPEQYKLFQKLHEKSFPTYDNRYANFNREGSLTPKKIMREVERAYIEEFRYPPDNDTQPLCKNNKNCLFYTYASEPNSPFKYIGKEFRLPHELEKDNEIGGRNIKKEPLGPCIDCLIYGWSIDVFFLTSKRKSPRSAINTFTVLCEKGEYRKDIMLPNILDGKPTGIVGFVPIYSASLRNHIIVDRQCMVNGRITTIPITYLAEVNSDF